MLTPITGMCVICDKSLSMAAQFFARTCDDPACRLAYRRHLQSGKATCLACARPLSDLEQLRGGQVCESTRCRLHARRDTEFREAKRCEVCRVPLSPHRLSLGLCEERECQAVQAAKREAAAIRKRNEDFGERQRQAEQLRISRASAEGIAHPETYFPTVIPKYDGRLAPLPEERRKEFRDYLLAIVANIAALPDARQSADSFFTQIVSTDLKTVSESNRSPVSSPVEPVANHPWPDVGPEGERLSSRVCATCRGFCCQQGSTHAFLSEQRLKDFLAHRPDIKVDQVVDEYMHYVPGKTYENSCVYHSTIGCALPSDMRAEICGRYFCWGQQELRVSMERGNSRRAFVTIAEGEQIVAGHFFNEEPKLYRIESAYSPIA